MYKKTCCFTGSRPQNLPFGFNEMHEDCVRIKAILCKEIETLILKQGITHFVSGMALGVDQWAAEAVLSLRKIYPNITLEAAIPCEKQEINWCAQSRTRYFSILSLCNKKTVLQKQYSTDCMQKRNRYMVDNSRIVLAVWAGTAGGTASTVQYAKKCGKEIICINPVTMQVEYFK